MYLNRIHDYFNLLTLPMVFAAYCWHMWALYQQPRDDFVITPLSFPRESKHVAWDVCYWTFCVYIVVDSLWIILYPRTVKSPTSIIVHHVICVIGWQICHLWPGWEFYISYGLCVEINTFFLIAKRQLKYPILYWLDDFTWFVTRLLMFPVNAYNMVSVWLWMSQHPMSAGMPLGGYCNTGLYAATTCVLVTCQNFMWTKDKWFKNKNTGKEKGL